MNEPGPAGIFALQAGPAGLDQKEAAVRRALIERSSVVVAYSGGVDSAYLAYVATAALGERALCVTADSPSYPERHRRMAVRLARQFGFRHEIIRTDDTRRRGVAPAPRASSARLVVLPADES